MSNFSTSQVVLTVAVASIILSVASIVRSKIRTARLIRRSK
jgi:hypothetical protein